MDVSTPHSNRRRRCRRRHRIIQNAPPHPTSCSSTHPTPPHPQALSPEDLAKLQISDDKNKGREKTRLTKSTGQSIKEGGGRIGGPFTVAENPAFLAERLQTYEALAAKRRAELDGK